MANLPDSPLISNTSSSLLCSDPFVSFSLSLAVKVEHLHSHFEPLMMTFHDFLAHYFSWDLDFFVALFLCRLFPSR